MGKPEGDTVILESMISVCVEAWRLSKVFSKIVSQLDVSEQAKYISNQRYFLKQLESNLDKVGIKLIGFDGTLFDPGLPVAALNLNDFPPDARLIVSHTIEPTVMGQSGIVRMGSVILVEAQV